LAQLLGAPAFYDEIDQHPIPVEREVVAMPANALGVLDLYLWLVWKTWSLSGGAVGQLAGDSHGDPETKCLQTSSIPKRAQS
jgi:hypothetical protein